MYYHQCGTVNINSQYSDDSFVANVLLTTARDNVVRVWTETNETEDLQFHVCYASRSDSDTNVQWLNTPHEVSPNEVLLHYLKDKPRNTTENDTHTGNNTNAQSLLQNQKLRSCSDTGNFESQTWLGSILRDGSLNIDLIQGFADFPRRTPKHSPWIRMPNALQGIEQPLQIFIYYKTAKDAEDDEYSTPHKLILYVHSSDGVISSWNFSLGKGSGTPSLTLFKVYTGHLDIVQKISAHPTLPLVASVDPLNQQLITWHSRDSAHFTPDNVLTNINCYKCQVTSIAWFPCNSALFASTSEGIELLRVNCRNPSQHNLSSSTLFPPLPSYYDVSTTGLVLEGSEYAYTSCRLLKVFPVSEIIEQDPNTYLVVHAFVVAVSDDSKSVAVWKVESQEDSNYTATQILNHKFSSDVTVVSADCEKLQPFIYDLKMTNTSRKNITASSDCEAIKRYNMNKQQSSLVLSVGTRSGKVILYKLGYEEKKVEPKKAVPRMGGLLARYTQPTVAVETPSASTSDNLKYTLTKWMEFQAYETQPIRYIKSTELPTRICVGVENSNSVQIWEAESHTDFSLEQTITVPETEIITDFQWQTYGDGYYILSVGTNKGIHVYTQSKTSKTTDNRQYWRKVCDLASSAEGDACTSITSTREQTLIAAFGSKMHVFTKWLKVTEYDDALSIRSKVLEIHRKLPDYHPRVLIDLLMSGQFNLVKKILLHLAKYLRLFVDKETDTERTLYIPTLSISTLLQTEKTNSGTSGTAAPQKRKTLLDKYAFLDQRDEDDSENKNEKDTVEMKFADAYKVLCENITKVSLPDLSGTEVLHLVAIVDTFNQIQMKPEALDDSAIRYLVAYKIDQFASRRQRKAAQAIQQQEIEFTKQIDSSYVAWAVQSESQETLLNMLNLPDTVTWNLYKKLGLVYWLRNPKLLAKTMNQLANDQFKKANDPTACALLYVAMGKKSVLIQLFKLSEKQRVADFFKKDFTSPKDVTAAARNAFELMKGQKFQYAAAFYLLSGQAKDAIDILIKKEQDPELAYLIARLYCGDDSDITKGILEKILLPKYKEMKDAWMQSAIHWILKNYEDSLKVSIERFKEEEGSASGFDPSLFAYCSHLASKFQLAESTLLEDNRESLILRTAHHFTQTGSLVLAVEHLKKLGDGSQTRKSRVSDKKNSAGLMTGTLDMSSFNFGGGGFGMGMGMGMGMNMGMNNRQNTMNQLVTKPAEEEVDRTDLTKLMKFNLCLSLLCQELFDLSNQENPSVTEDWERNKKKLDELITDLVASCDVDMFLLKKKLREFTRLNGLLTARCMLAPDTKGIAHILELFSQQIVTSLSLLVKQPLSSSQLVHLNRLSKEYIYCYERFVHEKGSISQTKKADVSATIYTLLFLSAWSRRDCSELLLLFTLHEKLKNQTQEASDQSRNPVSKDLFTRIIGEDPAIFLRKYREIAAAGRQDRIMTKELERDDRKKARMTGTVSESEKKKKWEEFIARYHETDTDKPESTSQTTEEEKLDDVLVDKLKQEFYWLLFNAMITYRFTISIKEFLDKMYEQEPVPEESRVPSSGRMVKNKFPSSTSIGNFQSIQYTLPAQTVVSSLSLWCAYLNRRLVYKEMEVYTASPEYPTPSFKEVNTLAEPSHLSNIIDALVFAGPVFRHRKQRHHHHHRLDTTNMQSLDHALPELGALSTKSTERVRRSFFSSIDTHWFQDIAKVVTFDADTECKKLWKFLIADEKIIPDSVVMSSMRKSKSTQNINTSSASSDHSFKRPTQRDESISFSADIEIVKCRDLVRSFCVDRNNPNNMAYATSKLIREVNIEHSIRYRKRNPSLDKLMDEEANSWEAALHRFDAISMHDESNMKSANAHAHIPSNSGLSLFDFINPNGSGTNDALEEQPVTKEDSVNRANKFVGIGNEGFHKHQNVADVALSKIKKRLNLGRRPSFTSHYPSASHFKKQSFSKSKKKLNVSVDHNQIVTRLETHPFLPFYVSGGVDGAIHMWQYGMNHALRTYREPSNSSVTSLRFSRFGYKFGATDSSGNITLWRFEASKDSLQAFDCMTVHSGRANDFAFLDSGSVVATIGSSNSGSKNLCIWDMLLPHYESCIYSHSFNDEPTSIAYSAKYKSILVGNRRGEVSIFDIRGKNLVQTFNLGTNTSVDTLALDVTADFFVTGSSEGDVQVWDTKNLYELQRFSHAHGKHNFFNLEGSNKTMSTLGVTQCDLSTSFLYTSGADGRIIRKTIV
jgi:hypothetical protein